MWLRRGDQTVLVPAYMADTIARCLKDGWVETTDPRMAVEAQPAIEPAIPEPVLEPKGAPAEPAPKGKRG